MERKLEVVTTYNKKYYDICGKKMIQTFIEHWPKDVTLYCYYQNRTRNLCRQCAIHRSIWS